MSLREAFDFDRDLTALAAAVAEALVARHREAVAVVSSDKHVDVVVSGDVHSHPETLCSSGPLLPKSAWSRVMGLDIHVTIGTLRDAGPLPAR
ncbi:hypothetical protein [Rathayibacter iranicus]|uniref:hypothetical protein n=1 Tax=Rathayibacter iranicus TaxID=59737 RepID=UPI000FDABDEA|nr:hypothetical protein [Rathayibacter iranicus]MWV31452.1 hypothetical protein [Rathayibacter iranicus NCPPB 2253 = VKM Ac-1602]